MKDICIRAERKTMEILKIKPVFKEMIWGGSLLKEKYQFDIPSNHTGEAWVVSAHEEGDCIIENGQFAGQSLSKVYRENRSIFGKGSNIKFPLLVKIIDAKQDLSIQIHPDDKFALMHDNSYGKTEAWLILDCQQQSKIIIGHHLASKRDFEENLANKILETKLNSFHIKKDDFFYIPAKTLHAICANTLVYEVQQNSNITYRVYDYNRVDFNGNTRALQSEKALEIIQFPDKPCQSLSIAIQKPGLELTELINEYYFSIRKAVCTGVSELIIEEEFVIVGCIEGFVSVNHLKLIAGEHIIVPNYFRKVILSGEGVLILSAPKEPLL